MGSKKTLPIYYPFNALGLAPNIAIPLAVTGTNTYHSNSTFIGNVDNVGCQVAFVGTMSGTFEVDVSNDQVNWDSLTFDPAITQPAGADTSFGLNLNQLSWAYLRFSYVNATGSGTLTVTIFAKDLN